MPVYEYEALDSSGKLVTGTSSHPNEAFARAKLEKLGLHPVKLSVKDQQQQVDDTESPDPWRDFAKWFVIVGMIALICATVFAPKSWFPHKSSGVFWCIAIVYTWFCLELAGRDRRFLFYLVKFILVVPVLIAVAFIESLIVAGVIWFLIMFYLTVFHKDP